MTPMTRSQLGRAFFPQKARQKRFSGDATGIINSLINLWYKYTTQISISDNQSKTRNDCCISHVLKRSIEPPLLDLHLSILDGFNSCKIYDKRGDFDFELVNFPYLDRDLPRRVSYGVYISHLIRFARVSSHVTDFNTRNKLLTAKLLNHGYWYHKLRKAFSKFYRRHFDLVSQFNVGLKSLLQQGLAELEFYGDLEYKFS